MTMLRFTLAGILAMLLGTADGAPGAQITVTMKDDVVANDGRCSLREAISAANSGSRSGSKPGECVAGERVPVVDVIQLRRGTYRLKRGGAGDDRNLGGDLDVTESVVIQGKGQKGTVIQNAVGSPAVDGDGDRLFHVDPGALGGVDVIFSKLTLARGDVTCAGEGCDPGASAVENRGSGSVAFQSCMLLRNRSTCSGAGCGRLNGGAAIGSYGRGALTVRDTTLKKNSSICASKGCIAGAAVIASGVENVVEARVQADAVATAGGLVLENSTITQNEVSCAADNCGAGSVIAGFAGDVALRTVALTLNASRCTGVACAAAGVLGVFAGRSLVADRLDLANNELGCEGDGCYLAPALYLASAGDTAVRGAKLHADASWCQGESCYVTERYAIAATKRVVVEGVEASDHTMECSGVRCGLGTVIGAASEGPVDVVDVRVARSEISCESAGCESGALVGWYGAPVRIDGSAVEANRVSCAGDRCGLLRPVVGIDSRGAAVLKGQVVRDNRSECSGQGCVIDDGIEVFVDAGGLTLEEPVLASNLVHCTGLRCKTEEMLELLVGGGLVIDRPAITDNLVRCDGDLCRSGGVGLLQARELLLADGDLLNNATFCFGAACRGVAALDLAAQDATIERTWIGGNQARCTGEDCGTGTGGALRNRSSRLTIRDSELSFNASDGFGGAAYNDAGSTLILERSVVKENEAGLRGVMEFGGFGGGIYNGAANGVKGTLTLVDSEVRGNRSLKQGGGVLNRGTVSPLVRSAITGNSLGDCVDAQTGAGCP